MRFSLKTLLILLTALAVFLGYSQWRRAKILGSFEQFPPQGITIHVPNAYFDRIWQRHPHAATIRLNAAGASAKEFPHRNLVNQYRQLRELKITDLSFVVPAARHSEALPWEAERH